MSVASGGPDVATTEHGLLVAFGKLAGQVGLMEAFARVPFAMKTVEHSPGDKLAELTAHILAGGMHVKELETAARPLVADRAVAAAWGQASFASASGVSALLGAADEASVAGLKEQVAALLAPFRRRALRDLSLSWLVVDFDLTGLVVSDQATTYEGAGYGYMGEVGRVAKGYQFARAQLETPVGPYVLGGALHPGRAVSPHCLRELAALVEATLGAPRRRVEAVAARLAEAERALAELDAALAARGGAPARGTRRLTDKRDAKAAEVDRLRARRDQLAAENAANPRPRRVILRLDGGFGDAEALAWLYEQGYDFVARAHDWRVGERLCAEEGLAWEKVSKNGHLAESATTTLGACPYPMRLFACRQWRGEGRPERHSALVASPELGPAAWPARRVGVFYNGRQSIEAGIKEGKGVFASRHLPTRRKAGIALYEELVLLAQNLVRWFTRLLADRRLLAAGVKETVRVGMNSRALILRRAGAATLQFTGDSPWRGLRLHLGPRLAHQTWFPFLEDPSLAAHVT
jgi:Transposase DDE domain